MKVKMLTVLLTLTHGAGCLCLPPLTAARSLSRALLPGAPLHNRGEINSVIVVVVVKL